MKLRKIILSLSCAFICMCSLPSNIKANDEGRYFITIEDSKADQYVSDTTSASKILSVIEKWNLVYGGYSSNIGNHALLIHGIDGNKVHVWNPWNLYSECSSSAGTYKSGGTTFSMYRYVHFIK